ncbi:MAG: NYN domain-containing protein [Magnetococcales bacterium]|nr:NYN domain-containing protein [Magnetococcales bacterium]
MVGTLRTAVYIDGFNLYHRALRNTKYKWLNLKDLATHCLGPENEVVLLKYFTARVSGRKDPDQPRRQEIYLKALRTIPNLSIYFGRFLTKTKMRPLVNPQPGCTKYAEFFDTEEKGSDVNLAVHMLHDGWKNLYDVAVVITKDTDLIEPIRIVIDDLKKPVILFCPDNDAPKGLKDVVSYVRHVTPQRLSVCQFPDVIVCKQGNRITKPDTW